MTKDQFLQAAQHDVDAAFRMLSNVALDNPRKKLTVAQLNELLWRTQNARNFLEMARKS